MVSLFVAISVSFGGLDQINGVLDEKERITIWVRSLVFGGMRIKDEFLFMM